MKIGSKHSEATREKIRLTKIGRVPSEETRKKISEANKGHPCWTKGIPRTQETKEKLSKANKGKRLGMRHTPEAITKIKAARARQVITPETRAKMSAVRKGRKFTAEHRANMGRSGPLNPFWKGGVTPINVRIRMSTEYKEWRKHVFTRDDYTCQACGIRGGYLEADHVLPFAQYPDLRFEVLNGQTLCEPCHRKTPTYGRKTRIAICLHTSQQASL
jgi:hypothetical protein